MSSVVKIPSVPEYSSITTDGYYNTTSKYEQAGFIVTVRKEEGYRYGYINNKVINKKNTNPYKYS